MALLKRIRVTTSASFCGHLSKELMDAVSLASTFLNMFGTAAIAGLNTACYTMFSQIYGSQNKESMGITLQKSLLILLLSCVPITALFLYAEQLMVLVGENADIARNAGKYILYANAGLPAVAISSVLRSYTYTQGHVHVHYLILVISYIFHIGLQFLLLDVLHLEISGAGLVSCVTNWLIFALYMLFFTFMTTNDSLWHGWTIECVDNLSEILRLAIPGMIMSILEWGVYDILTFLVGLFGKVELAAYSITYYLTFIIATIPVGLSNGVSVRVGHLLGANKPDLAKFASITTVIIAPLVALLFLAGLLCFRQYIPHLFTKNRNVIELTVTYLLWTAPQGFLIAVQIPLKGVLRGIGQQAFGAVVNVMACLLIGLPVAVSVMFETYIGVIGSYLGMVLAHSVQLIMCIVRLSRVDWDHAAKLAAERSNLKLQERSKAVVPDEGSETTPISHDDGQTGSQKHSDVSTSKGYGAVQSSVTDKEMQKKYIDNGRMSDKGDLTQDMCNSDGKICSSVDTIRRRKRFLWYKLAAIVSACLLLLGVSVYLNHLFTVSNKR